MLNKNAAEILSQVNNITNSVIIRYPQTVAVSESQDMKVLVDFTNIDDPYTTEIPVKDGLSDLLSLLKMFPEDRSVSISENAISVVSGDISSTFVMDNVALMDAYNATPDQFAKTEEVPSVTEFTLTAEDIKNIRSATGVFKDLTEVVVTSQDGDVTISLAATNKFNARSNNFSLSKRAQTSKEFSVKIPVENFKKIPQSEYSFAVKYNSQRDAYRLLLSNTSLAGFKIMMSVKA